jgi:cytochrome c-type biogenesis protein CcmE
MRNSRANRLVLVGGIMIGLLGLMYMSVDPETQYSVDELMNAPSAFTDDEVHIRGIVTLGSVDTASATFKLAGDDHQLLIAYGDISVPDGFDEGRTIAVKGHLTQDAGEWILSANEIQTGCPSKYEAE